MVLCKCLPEPSGDVNVPIVYHGLSLLTRIIESAGSAFFEAYERTHNGDSFVKLLTEKQLNKKDSFHHSNEVYEKKKGQPRYNAKTPNAPFKLKRLINGPNLYLVLGLQEGCSMEAIKKAYRQLALQYHPDKQKAREMHIENGVKQSDAGDLQVDSQPLKNSNPSTHVTSRDYIKRAKELEKYSDKMYFLLVQEAYNALSNAAFRRQYDSSLPFDDSIPSAFDVDVSNPESFFTVFEPVFQRNARWSAKKHVPSLGNLNTPFSEVNRFYQFWKTFESTREFAIHNEYDPLDAECREERRWMERENMKIQRKYIREEISRINRLVDVAYSLDPRIQRAKQEEVRERKQMKQEKKRLLEQKSQKERLENEEKEKQKSLLEEEEMLKVKLRIEKKQRLKAELKQKRKEIRLLCLDSVEARELEPEDLETVCLNLPLDQLTDLLEALKDLSSKALGPNDISNKVHEFLRAHCPHEKTPEEANVKKELKELNTTSLTPTSGAQAHSTWSPEELSLLEKAIQRYPVGTIRRWQLIAEEIRTKSLKDIISRTRELMHRKPTNLNAITSDQYVTSKSFTETQKTSCSDKIQNPPLASCSTWSTAQQQALESALQSSKGRLSLKEEWLAIAQEVPGKTAKECFLRFKEIRAACLASFHAAD